MENQKIALFTHSLKIGALYGLLSIVISLLIYIFNVNMLSIGFGIVYFIISVGLSVVVFIYGMRTIRDKYFNGYISYGHKFLVGLIIGLVSGWIAGLFGLLLYVYYDPGFIADQIDKFVIKLEEYGVDETTLMKQEESMREGFTAMGQIKSMLIRTPIFTVVLSLIVAAFVKKEINKDDGKVL
ncbi:MAG: DUF4199 domain-containing protein [Bacteroidetes bacterium]|nr:DUF4199 domain-containing protein [Bacteroidota bacterium]